MMEWWEKLRLWLAENRDALQALQALVDIALKVLAMVGGGLLGWSWQRKVSMERKRLLHMLQEQEREPRDDRHNRGA